MASRFVGRWLVSTDEEVFNAGDYATKEEAIARAPVDLDLGPGARFWVGLAVEASWSPPDGGDVIEHLACQAQDEYGEAAEDWPDASREEEEELDRLIADVVNGWIERHGLQPTFCGVTDVEVHVVPERAPSPRENTP